jgi:hypothetical protein
MTESKGNSDTNSKSSSRLLHGGWVQFNWIKNCDLFTSLWWWCICGQILGERFRWGLQWPSISDRSHQRPAWTSCRAHSLLKHCLICFWLQRFMRLFLPCKQRIYLKKKNSQSPGESWAFTWCKSSRFSVKDSRWWGWEWASFKELRRVIRPSGTTPSPVTL